VDLVLCSVIDLALETETELAKLIHLLDDGMEHGCTHQLPIAHRDLVAALALAPSWR